MKHNAGEFVECRDVWYRQAVDDGLDVSYGFMFPSLCGTGMASLFAGTMRRGVFYPAGPVAKGFFEYFQADQAVMHDTSHVYFTQPKVAGTSNQDSTGAGC